AGPAVAVQGVGALGQDGHVPLAHHLGVVLQFGQDVPVALQEHGAVTGKEGGAGAGLGKVGLGGAPVVLLQVDVKLHPHPGGGVVEVGAGLVLGQDAAAGLVDKVPVAQLVVAVGHVAVIAGGVVDLLGCFAQGVPGPGVVGIADPGGVEHLLVVDKAHRVLVFGHGVQLAVRAAGVGQRNVGEVLGLDDGRAVGQLAVVGILQDLVGVHPENVGGLAGHGVGLQLGPVFVPAGDLYLDDHIGVLDGVGVTHGLHPVPLGDVPDLERQMGL